MAEGSSEEDEASKTEDPTPKKLEDALKKGQVINSKEVTSFIVLVGATFLLIWIFPLSMKSYAKQLQSIIDHSPNIPFDPSEIGKLFIHLLKKTLILLSPLFILVVFFPIFSSFFQQGSFVFSTEQIEPKLSRISIMSGLKKLFSMRSVVELIKNLLKLGIVGFFIYLVIMMDIKHLKVYYMLSIDNIISQMHSVVKHILILVSVSMSVVAIIDYMYQHFQYFKSLRMSKHEIKQEFKETEGSPEIKSKLRSLRQSMARKRMMANVPKADVIITNPEHYAIAIFYDSKKHKAPIVVAKGIDLVAQKIKDIAYDNNIPLVRNPPLARSLYKVEIDSHIPAEHYEAVAKIIGYVYQLRQARKGK